MRKGSITAIAAAGIFGASLILGAGTPLADTDKPKYGGSLEIGTVYVTLTALSWDAQDFNWKHNHDTGQFYEQLFAADLSKSVKNGGPHPFYADAWLPSDAIRGELAESWEWKENPLRVEIKLRKGIMFPEKPGVMASRELVADDVVFSYNRLANSPRKLKDYFNHIAKVEATDKHTVVFTFNGYFAEWDYRFGYGYYSGIYPKEVADAGAANWKNVNGTGPFMLTDFVQGNSNTYTKNPIYWDKDKVNGGEYKLPVRRQARLPHHQGRGDLRHRAQDRQARHPRDRALAERRGAEEERAPAQVVASWLNMSGTYLAFQVDTKPFDDVRVRRALNMAVNKKEIVSAYYNGNAELFAYPMHPDYKGYYEPLEAMPASVKELFEYNPDKAKKLLAEAGVPNGFSFKVQVCACNPDHMDLLPLVAAYLEKVGVKIEIQPMEYAAFLSAMTSRKMTAGYFMNNGHTNPTTTIRKSFTTGQQWNPSGWSDPAYDRKMDEVYAERDEGKRQAMLKEMTREILDKAPYIWLPTPYIYTRLVAVGEELQRRAACRLGPPGPIYARIWVDQELKKKMGY